MPSGTFTTLSGALHNFQSHIFVISDIAVPMCEQLMKIGQLVEVSSLWTARLTGGLCYQTGFKYHRNLCIVTFVITVGNNILHCVSAVMTVVITVLRK